MPVWLAVAVGGALGSLARWQAGVWLRTLSSAFPWGTLVVNVSGSFIIGFVAAYCAERAVADWIRIGLMTGVLGGFTTFSAFSLDTLELWKVGASPALFNVASNLLLGLAACVLGVLAARPFAP